MSQIYKILIDCDISLIVSSAIAPPGAIGFYSNNFVVSISEDQAVFDAIDQTMIKMKKKGYSEDDIKLTIFNADEVSKVNSEEVDLLAAEAFIYYNIDE